MELIDEILGGLTPVQFLAAYFFLGLGLWLNMLRGAAARISAPVVRKVRYKLFAVRVASSLLAGFIIILLCKDIFGVPLSKWLAVMTGLAIEVAIEKLFTFARNFFNNNQNFIMENEELIYVLKVEDATDKIAVQDLHAATLVADFATATGATVENLEGEDPLKLVLVYNEKPPFTGVAVLRDTGSIYPSFVGHVPRPPKVVDSE